MLHVTRPRGAVTGGPAAKPECEHYWAFHCYDGLSVRLCQLCHEPDWDDLREQLKAAANKLALTGKYPASG